MKPLLKETTPRRRRKTHSIQMIDVPPTPDKRRGLQFSLESKIYDKQNKNIVNNSTAPQLKISG